MTGDVIDIAPQLFGQRDRWRRSDTTHGNAMTKDLQFTWMAGKVRVTHAGFAVYAVRGRSSSPADLVSGPHESAHEAVETAERLGEGYAAFRVVHSSAADVEARELLSRDDLPVNFV